MSSERAHDSADLQPEAQEPPPILGSWRNVYWVLVLELLTITAILFALTTWLS